MVYLRARYYDTYLNQFIQPDTIVPDLHIPADWNKYTYTRDNPINFTDPSGHKAYYYNGYAAAQYALKYELIPNLTDYGLPFSNDCTSFVSQALKAGGLPEDNSWYFSKKGIAPLTCSKYPSPLGPQCGPDWALVPNLLTHLTSINHFYSTDVLGENGKRVPMSPNPISLDELSSVQIGDAVFYSQDAPGKWNHAAIVVGWGPLTNVAHKEGDEKQYKPLVPMVVDHSAKPPYSLAPRSINDISEAAIEIKIVHISQVIFDPLQFVDYFSETCK